MNVISIEQKKFIKSKKSSSKVNLSSSANLTIDMEEARKKLSFLSKGENHRQVGNMKKKDQLTLNISDSHSRPSIKSIGSTNEVQFTFEKKTHKPLIYPMALSLLNKNKTNNISLKLDKPQMHLNENKDKDKIFINYMNSYKQSHLNWLQKKTYLDSLNYDRVSAIKKFTDEFLKRIDKLYSSHYLIKEAFEDLIRVNQVFDKTIHIHQKTKYNCDQSREITVKKHTLSQEIFQIGATVKNINLSKNSNKLTDNISFYGQDMVYIGKKNLHNNSNVLEIELRDGHGNKYLGANIAKFSIKYLLERRQQLDLRNKISENLLNNNFEYAIQTTLTDYDIIQEKLLKELPEKGGGSTSISCQLYNLNSNRKVGVFANLGDSEIFALVFKPNQLKSKILLVSEAHNADNDQEAQRILDKLGEKIFKLRANPIYGRGGVASCQYEDVVKCLNQTKAPNSNKSIWLMNDKVPIYDVINGKAIRNLHRAYAFSTGIGKFAKREGYNPNFCAGFQSMRRSTLISKNYNKSIKEREISTGQLAQHLGNNFAGTLNGHCQCSRSFHDLLEQPRGSISTPYCSIYEFDPKDHVIIVCSSDGFGDMFYITQLVNTIEKLYKEHGKDITAKNLTENLWENMLLETRKEGHSFKNGIPSWDDISLAIINSPPLI